MRNAGLDEAQAGIKIAGRDINNLKYTDDTTLMSESKEELKNLLMKMKEESDKAGLKVNIQNAKTMDGIQSHHFMALFLEPKSFLTTLQKQAIRVRSVNPRLWT